MGHWKTYPIFAETSLSNKLVEEKHYADARNKYSRNLDFHLMNGNDRVVNDILRRVFNTFIKEHHGNIEDSQMAFQKWFKRKVDSFGKHPKLRHLSKDELIARHGEAARYALEARTTFSKQMSEALLQERRVRSLPNTQLR
jgi:hypothetical protein